VCSFPGLKKKLFNYYKTLHFKNKSKRHTKGKEKYSQGIKQLSIPDSDMRQTPKHTFRKLRSSQEVLIQNSFISYCCSEWGYIVPFTKVLTYLNSSPPPCHSPLSLSPPAWSSFNRYNFSIYIHLYIVFALYSSSYTLSPHLLPSYNPQIGPVQKHIYHIQITKNKNRENSFSLAENEETLHTEE
jgi:hypothetical protein